MVLTAAEILLAWRVAWCRLRSPVLALAIACALGVAYALAARWVVGGYARIAEMIGREEWLVNPMALRVSGSGSGNGPVATAEDVIVGTRVGDDIVGALVLRLEPSPAAMALAAASAAGPGGGGSGSGSGGGPMSVSGGCGNVITGGGGGEGGRRRRGGSRHGSVAGLKGGRGLVRAWTVHPHYRHRGLGSDLLHEAVRFTRERCGRDAEVGFAREHAHSRMVLPELFNRGFRRRERMAAWALRDVLAEWDMTRRKR